MVSFALVSCRLTIAAGDFSLHLTEHLLGDDMLNLVDGTRAVLRSKSDAFPPLELHYAETCIVPQAAGDYEISSPDGSEVKVILACVRN